MTAHLYIIRGVPGSGKTTLAHKMLRAGMVDCVREADDYMRDDRGAYKFDPSRLSACHYRCLAGTRSDLEAGLRVAVANTFTQLWEVEKYTDLGFPFTVITCEGRYQNTHGVPDATVAAMRARFAPYAPAPEVAE